MAQDDAARYAGKVVFTPDMEGDLFPEVWGVEPSIIPCWLLFDALASAAAYILFMNVSE